MKVYVDNEFKCHTAPAEGMIAVETPCFDGKCPAYIEGYRFVPEGRSWTREDGTVFTGEMVAPWKSWEALDAIQRDYEQEQAAALVEAMAEMVEAVYNQDLAVIEEG